MANLQARSALADLHNGRATAHWENKSVNLRELTFLGMVRLQGPGTDKPFIHALKALKIPLPEPCRVTEANEIRCLWLGPNEWLLTTAPGTEDKLLEKLNSLNAKHLMHAGLMTDSRVAIEVSGGASPDLLSKGCSLDLHGSVFKPGHCAVTRFANIPLMITRTDDNTFEIYVDRAQAHYIWDWLVDAASEFA